MEAKKRKRCSVRLMSKGKKIQGQFNGTVKTEGEKRCLEWIQSQNKIPKKGRKTFIDRNSTTKYDRTPDASSDSLSILKEKIVKGKFENVFNICEWKDCMQEFEEAKDIHDHVRVHIINLNPVRKKYHCYWDLCNFQTECGDEITRHIFYHAYHTILKTTGETIFQKVHIARCTNDSKERNLVPDLKEDFTCFWDDCKEKFKSIHFFHLHVREHVSFENTIRKSNRVKFLNCKWNSCNKTFNVAYRLTEHLKKHIKEKIIGCYHCGAIFFNNTNFFDHCKRQEVSQDFQCVQCLKYFASERLLRVHVNVHVYSHKCTICEMTCISPYALRKHIQYRHILDKPFHCSYCKYRCVDMCDLKAHVLNMHKKRSFPCKVMGCKYSGKSTHFLRKHVNEVHTKALYDCHCCEKRYKHGRELSKHLKKNHNYQMLPGHRRFIYRIDEDGFYRLQTLRIESLEVTEQVSPPQNTTPARCESISVQIDESANVTVPFKIIATHDTVLENLDLPEKFEEKYCEDTNQISCKDIIITFKEIDDDGNVIQSQCISGNEITMS